MSTLKVTNLQHPSAASANVTLDSSGNADFNGKNLAGVASVNGGQLGARNRITNGSMLIDQRNSGSSWNATNGGFSLDRWKVNSFDGGAATGKFSVQQSSTAPDNFSNSLLVTSLASTADAASNIFNVEQLIEGYNTFDFAFGTSAAKTITLSFWVRSSLTGTFGGAIKNSARNRAYPFTYTISSANTFEYKTITIAGDTSGTWVGATNGTGLWVSFGLGVGSSYSGTAGAWNSSDNFSATGATSVVGTSGATWYLAGVMLETGDTATSFEHESYGTTLQKCQRYYVRETAGNAYTVFLSGGVDDANGNAFLHGKLPVSMRATPSFSTSGCELYSRPDGGLTTGTFTNRSSTSQASLIVGITGGTQGNVARFESSTTGGTAGIVEYDAEL